MDDFMIKAQASEDFNKARSKEFFSRLLGFLSPKNKELLSFREIKALVGAKGERYKGMQVVPIEKIIGSEGRYRDFNKTFLPKHNFLRNRWEKVDRAHLKDIVLPPIKLYQLGDYYFVRDGNHRVSVAKSQGVHAIDAEVVEVKSDIILDKNVKIEELKETIIQLEKAAFFQDEIYANTIPLEYMDFSETGRYEEIATHIQGHKYFINEDKEHEISLEEAASSWYEMIFLPTIKILEAQGILLRFPGRTKADLYTWIVKHWYFLKEKYGDLVSIEDAAVDFSERFGKSIWRQIWDFFFKKK